MGADAPLRGLSDDQDAGRLPGLPRIAVLVGRPGGRRARAVHAAGPARDRWRRRRVEPEPERQPARAHRPAPRPTAPPAPTPQVYVIKQGDTLSKIAKQFGLTLEELLAANTDTIKNPNKIAHRRQQIIIPIAGASAAPSAPPAPSGRRAVASESGAPAAALPALARGDVDRGDLAGLDAERRVDVLALRPRPDDEEVRLLGVAGVADLARDHPQALLAAQEPAADALDAAQRLHAVADVHAHLGLLVHQRDRGLAIAAVQLLEEVFHRLDSTHGRSVPSGAHGRPDRRSTDAWPLFGLRLRTERLVLRLPTDDDLVRL